MFFQMNGNEGSFGEAIIGNARVTSPAPRSAWREILEQDPGSLIFQTPEWTDAICSSENYEDASRLYELPEGRRWLVPLVAKRSGFSALKTQASLPHGWGLGGAISSQPFGTDEARITFDDVSRLRILRSVIHPSPLQSPVWESGLPSGVPFTQKLEHILDLEGDFSTVWEKRFQSTTRTAIRKAERSNLTVEVGSSGELNQVYYDMFIDWSIRRGRDRHLPAWLARWTNQRREPLARLEHMSAQMGDAYRVYVASREGTPVAAAILLVYGKDAVFYRGTSRREQAHPVRANDLLQCLMIQAACQAGCQYYHMGESGGVEIADAF